MRVICGRAVSPRKWGCSKCERPDTSPESALPEAVRRSVRNCDGVTNEAFRVEGHDDLRRCPWSQVTASEELAVERWSRWKRLGVLPFRGDGPDQPAAVLDDLEVCEEAWISLNNELRPQPQRQPKKESKRGG